MISCCFCNPLLWQSIWVGHNPPGESGLAHNCSSFCAVIALSWSACASANCRCSFNCSISLDLWSSDSCSTYHKLCSALCELTFDLVFYHLCNISLLYSIVLIIPVSLTKTMVHHHLHLGWQLEHPPDHISFHLASSVSFVLFQQLSSQ